MRGTKSTYSLDDIAKVFGVSKATVSRALNNGPGVGQELRKKITQYANEIGYVPNSLAQGLATGRQKIVALIVDDIRNPFYAELSFQLQQILSQSGYMLMILNCEYKPEQELKYLQMITQSNFAGLFILTVHSDSAANLLEGLDIPVVLVNRTLATYHGSQILLDNFQAGYIAAMHLIELNHKQIGFICGPKTSTASYQRYQGYCQAISNFGVCNTADYYYESDLTMEGGYQVAKLLLDAPSPPPSAIIIANDLAAIGFMNGIKEAGLRIPEDLSIVSFDNISFSAAAGIDLTTVDQHVQDICHSAAKVMLTHLSDSQSIPETVIITPTLVIRKTTRLLSRDD